VEHAGGAESLRLELIRKARRETTGGCQQQQRRQSSGEHHRQHTGARVLDSHRLG